jgi:hypothetical protein
MSTYPLPPRTREKTSFSTLRSSSVKLVAVILAIAMLGLSVIGQYGISYDEEGPMRVAFETAKTVNTGKPYAGHLKYYGTLFNVSAETVFQLKNRLLKPQFPPQDRFEGRGYVIAPFYQRVKLKHVMTFLLALVAYGAVAGLVAVLAGLEYAWLGPVTLALFPRFWGHSFVNPKDIPLAAMMTLGTLLGVYLIGHFQQISDKELRLGLNRTTLFSLGYGGCIGWVAGMRLDGSVVLLFTAIAHLLTSLGSVHPLWWLRGFWRHYGLIVLSWAATTFLVYPPAWQNPWSWAWETLQFYYHEDWPLTVLFDGQFLPAAQLHWYYLPQWWSITIPEVFQVAFAVGVMALIWKYKSLMVRQRACAIMILLQILFLPTLAVLLKSAIYDEARQFLYVIPGVAAIASTALIWLYKALTRRFLKLFVVALAIALFSPIVWDMVMLHPYQYLYFNRAFGGLAYAQGRFETDYWALSMREGMDWINRNAPANTTIFSSEPIYASAPIARADLRVLPIESEKAIETEKIAKPFYYIAIPRWDFQQQFPQCNVVYRVMRQGVPLTQIKQCRQG